MSWSLNCPALAPWAICAKNSLMKDIWRSRGHPLPDKRLYAVIRGEEEAPPQTSSGTLHDHRRPPDLAQPERSAHAADIQPTSRGRQPPADVLLMLHRSETECEF
jgi:hypothetical protein